MKDSWRRPSFCDTIGLPGVQPSRSAGRPRGVVMRLLQFSTLAIAALLAGCASHGVPMTSQSQRPLVETPRPAQLPNPPEPALKPAQQPGAAAPEAKTLPPSQGAPP